jgi:hypothetical protein
MAILHLAVSRHHLTGATSIVAAHGRPSHHPNRA